jgi:hypothetical protein
MYNIKSITSFLIGYSVELGLITGYDSFVDVNDDTDVDRSKD